MVIHKNEWKWGQSFDLILEDGTATISVSITNDEPEQAYVSALSVYAPRRNEGRGRVMMLNALDVARKNHCKYAYLMADKDSFVFEWYKRLGFKYYGHKRDENGLVPMYMDL